MPTFSFRKQTATILEFYLRFKFWHIFRHRCVTLHRPPNFIQIEPSTAELWRQGHTQNISRRPKNMKIGLAVRPDHKIEKRKGQSKSHKVVIFRLFGEKPPLCW